MWWNKKKQSAMVEFKTKIEYKQIEVLLCRAHFYINGNPIIADIKKIRYEPAVFASDTQIFNHKELYQEVIAQTAIFDRTSSPIGYVLNNIFYPKYVCSKIELSDYNTTYVK